MAAVGLWRVKGDTVSRVALGAIAREKNLEDWIVERPDLIRPGLVIIGRQFAPKKGLRIDLLGLDLRGRLALIELKRGQIDEKTLDQAETYAAALHKMTGKAFREVVEHYLERAGSSLQTVVAGTELNQNRLQMLPVDRYLVGSRVTAQLEEKMQVSPPSDYRVHLVRFHVLQVNQRERFLVRELEELTDSLNGDVFALAEAEGIGVGLREIHRTALDAGLSAELFTKQINYGAVGNPKPVLQVFAEAALGNMKVIVRGDRLQDTLSLQEVQHLIGGPELLLSEDQVYEFCRKLAALMRRVEQVRAKTTI